MAGSRFTVGIDLGTTHTVVAYAEANHEPSVFPIEQLVSPSEVAARPLLASALYAPTAAEGVADPWGEMPFVVGEFARARGSEVPGRLVASAKSWLSHAAVDREAPILPWGGSNEGDPEVPHISPVAASAAYLQHVQRTWDAAFPGHPLAEQEVVLTVPASFDPAARELTVAAATRAGLRVALLEEPQAAFYDYLQRSPSALRAVVEQTGGEATVLVCDVGGGTTDLSLMRLSVGPTGEDAAAAAAVPQRDLRAARLAVGRHLLLGGDNMDLALAHLCEARLGSTPMPPGPFAQLTAAARAAKETLLAETSPERASVTVLGTGSALLGAARTVELNRDEVRAMLLDGFFPEVALADAGQRTRAGLLGLGLPYERDVAITAHLAAFLRRHVSGARAPEALLLNGGVFRAPVLAQRIHRVVQSWASSPVRLLVTDAPDLAVARGAVTYGQSRRGHGARIESRSTRGYYIALDTSTGAASGRRQLLAVLPRGSPEDVLHRVAQRTFALTVGRPARFDLFSADEGPIAAPGDVVELDPERFTRLPPVVVRFQGGASAGEETYVALEAKLSQVGTLELACVEIAGLRRRFQLAFELRDRPSTTSTAPRPASARPRHDVTVDPKRLQEALSAVEQAFGKAPAQASARPIKDLMRELERLLGERATWGTELSRTLFDHVTRDKNARRRSADHERVFWMLSGYTMRPGFGHPGDEARLARVAPLFAEMLVHPEETRSWQQFWIAWRRTAPGFAELEQTRMRDLLDPFLAPSELRLKKRKGLRPLGADEMVELASYLERVEAGRRAELGTWIIDRTYTDRDHRLFSAIGRIGARIPLYASLHHVVAPTVAERWTDHLLREKWDEHPAAGEAAVQLCRFTGDRVRDVAEPLRAQVAKRLERAGFRPAVVQGVRELVEVTESESAGRFGESLPVGLRLMSG